MKYFDESVSASIIKEKREQEKEKREKEAIEGQVKKITECLLNLEKSQEKNSFSVNFKIKPQLKKELEELGYKVSSSQDRGSGYWETYISL